MAQLVALIYQLMFHKNLKHQIGLLMYCATCDVVWLWFKACVSAVCLIALMLQVGEALSNPVRISVGQLGAANQDVTQRVEVLSGVTHASCCSFALIYDKSQTRVSLGAHYTDRVMVCGRHTCLGSGALVTVKYGF
jgi:hypothetical protein